MVRIRIFLHGKAAGNAGVRAAVHKLRQDAGISRLPLIQTARAIVTAMVAQCCYGPGQSRRSESIIEADLRIGCK
jgi:hypothetical protein